MKNKGYEKALGLFNDGNIDIAIEICDREISKDLTNSNVINLKGLLLYLKGELEDAIALWNINKDYNDDNISVSYIRDIQKDFKRKELYEEAKELINNLDIDKAIDILNLCSKSDFNSININNDLALCYYKKGNHENARKYLDKVFSLDKKNKLAREINGKLNSIYKYRDRGDFTKKISLGFLMGIGMIAIVFITNQKFMSHKIPKINLEKNPDNIEKIVDNQNIVNKNQDISHEEVNIEKDLTEDEIRENYINATEMYDKEDYEKVKDILENTVSKLKGSHLDDDIIFLLGATYENLGYKDKAIEIFDRYISEYINGSYIEEAYYRAALLYRNEDIDISKNYANKILINYPNSIYNNSYVEEIMSS
ncbi:tetratricopeptide repeat protein [Clostridium sp. Sa3CUN1]|uniref:Tetratricopeptide repeat protein n=1 Tax=Clostridium gallinarum TaxID=2762246 RepID=A0ABR8Q847_9CLOT|nr:tetratricopeptide repeat protein [Clostridium gallinarum]MBD7916596.1 tetratricopeptide repeat protein [Clostridium gallinarum]